jgi:hypothetical protein
MDMSKEEIEELAIEAAGAEINGYRFGENGREPLYGIPTETDDGDVYYTKLELPDWLTRFAELLIERHDG